MHPPGNKMFGKILFFGLVVFLATVSSLKPAKGSYNQVNIDYVAENLVVSYETVRNLDGAPFSHEAEITLLNNGDQAIPGSDQFIWQLYLTPMFAIHPGLIQPNGTEIANSSFSVYHMDGRLHKFQPKSDFIGLLPGEIATLKFTSQFWSVTKYDMPPNWYVTSEGAEPRIVDSSVSDDMDFVKPFEREEQWKRTSQDQYDPYTPQTRLAYLNMSDLGGPAKAVIPTPNFMNLSEEVFIDLNEGDWVVVVGHPDLQNEASFLADAIGASVANPPGPSTNLIWLQYDAESLGTSTKPLNTAEESYSLNIVAADMRIDIIGASSAAVFHGVQTLISLYETDQGVIPEGSVVDLPRYPYRGMHIDVSRHFFPKEEIFKLIDILSMYKMNKLHLHLTDDEGWRLEIEGIEELTKVGANRCHDPDQLRCILPQLGSGPFIEETGSGYYTTSDYKEILQYAQDHHIQVIPEIDMPGHANAAIRSMEARFYNLSESDPEAAAEFLLSDPDDQSEYISQQRFTANAINPCLESTYHFVDHIIGQLVELHRDIQPLEIFHLGADEVANGAWEASPICEAYTETNNIVWNTHELAKHFVIRTAQIVHTYGLVLGGWQEGFLENSTVAVDIGLFPDTNIVAYSWMNMLLLGETPNTYTLANAGYQVVLSLCTSLYFDHPQEPEPNEVGFQWARRQTGSRRVFSFTPDDVYAAIDEDLFGNPLTKEDVCAQTNCVELTQEENIIGIQGQLWGESVRLPEQLNQLIYPRILALAERAWHKADWELGSSTNNNGDWQDFANTLGHKELKRLEDRGAMYWIPPPGADFVEGTSYELTALTLFPGLPIEYSLDDGNSWLDYEEGQSLVPPSVEILLRTRSVDGTRRSLTVSMTSPS